MEWWGLRGEGAVLRWIKVTLWASLPPGVQDWGMPSPEGSPCAWLHLLPLPPEPELRGCRSSWELQGAGWGYGRGVWALPPTCAHPGLCGRQSAPSAICTSIISISSAQCPQSWTPLKEFWLQIVLCQEPNTTSRVLKVAASWLRWRSGVHYLRCRVCFV